MYGKFAKAYYALKRRGLDRRDNANRKKLKSKAAGYPLKVEVLFRHPCECEWNSATQLWEVRCTCCKELIGTYVYDRGFTLVSDFHRLGHKVCLPNKKAKGQVAFDAQESRESRAQAIVRVHIERLNEELRKADAFNGLRDVSSIPMCSDEAQIARGFCNQRRVNHNHGLRSGKGAQMTDNEASSSEDGDAQDSDSAASGFGDSSDQEWECDDDNTDGHDSSSS